MGSSPPVSELPHFQLCSWLDRPVSGLLPTTIAPYSDSVSLRLPYRLSLPLKCKSLTHYTKGTQSHPLNYAPTACTHTVSGSISLPSQGFFSPFPHGTGSLSVDNEYLALEDGPPIFRQDNTCPALLNMLIRFISCTGLSPCIAIGLSKPCSTIYLNNRLFPFRSPLLRKSRLISFPLGYLDVSVPLGSLLIPYEFSIKITA